MFNSIYTFFCYCVGWMHARSCPESSQGHKCNTAAWILFYNEKEKNADPSSGFEAQDKTRKIMNVSVQYPEPLHTVNWQLQSIKMQRGLWDGSSREGWVLCLELRWRACAAALRGVIAAPPSSLFVTPPKTHLLLPPSRSLSFFVSISFSAALSFPFSLRLVRCWGNVCSVSF